MRERRRQRLLLAGGAVDRRLRPAGLVVEGSVEHRRSEVTFARTDMAHDVEVVFRGVLPDLFRAGQGIVAMGETAGDALPEAGHRLPEES